MRSAVEYGPAPSSQGEQTPNGAGGGATSTTSPRAAAYLRWSRRITLVGWLTVVGLVVWGVQSGALTSVARLRETLAGFGPMGPVVYALVGAAEAIFPVIPGSATIIAAPILFGPVVGFFAAYAATCLGSIAVFAISRHLGQELLYARFKASSVEKYLGWLQHRHFARWFALAIALPLAPDDLLCYLAGMSQMRWRTFVLVILLLKPWAMLFYIFGVLELLTRWFPWLAG